MIHAYDENYLNCATNLLAEIFDIAVNDLNISISKIFDLFRFSDIGNLFEHGDCNIVAGKSSIEILNLLLEEDIVIENNRFYATKEYWLGYCLAYYQWYKNISFKDINIPIEDILNLYYPYHEMDITAFIQKLDEMLNLKNRNISNLKYYRQRLNISQKDLASLSNVPLRTIQQYEQKQKNINKASAITVVSLSRVLMCDVIDLME